VELDPRVQAPVHKGLALFRQHDDVVLADDAEDGEVRREGKVPLKGRFLRFRQEAAHSNDDWPSALRRKLVFRRVE
jgi:hypothetical protein